MPRQRLRWIGSHRKLVAGLCLAAAFALFQGIAYRHAWTMTHFVPQGTKPKSPEELTLIEKGQILLTGITVPRPENRLTPQTMGLPFEVHRLSGTDGISLEGWYIPHGASKGCVLLFHGYASCKTALLPEAAAFHELGYATFLVDFRGSGGSCGNQTTIGVQEADDVVTTWEYVRARRMEQPLILYGHSMGSAAILRAVATKSLQPDASILECPFDRLLSTVENRFVAMGVPSCPAAACLVFWGGLQHGFNGFTHNPVDYARKVECPVLLLRGTEDPRVTQPQLEAIYGNLAGKKQLEACEGVGHTSIVSARPALWKSIVSRFLTQGAAGPEERGRVEQSPGSHSSAPVALTDKDPPHR